MPVCLFPSLRLSVLRRFAPLVRRKRKEHIPLTDSNLVTDPWVVRFFGSQGFELSLLQSVATNLGWYFGMLHVTNRLRRAPLDEGARRRGLAQQVEGATRGHGGSNPLAYAKVNWKHVTDLAWPDRTGQDRTGQDRTGQDRTGQDRTGEPENLIESAPSHPACLSCDISESLNHQNRESPYYQL